MWYGAGVQASNDSNVQEFFRGYRENGILSDTTALNRAASLRVVQIRSRSSAYRKNIVISFII